MLSDINANRVLTILGISIFFDKAGDSVPTVYEEFLRKFEARADVEVFLHFRGLNVPHVAEEDKFSVARTGLPNCYRIIVRHGYNDVVVNENLGELVYTELRRHLIQSWTYNAPAIASLATNAETSAADSPGTMRQTSVPNGNGELTTDDRKVVKRLEALDQAYATQTLYIVGKEQLRLLKNTNNIVKRMILEIFLWIRDNTRAKVASMKIPIEKLVEVGFVKEI